MFGKANDSVFDCGVFDHGMGRTKIAQLKHGLYMHCGRQSCHTIAVIELARPTLCNDKCHPGHVVISRAGPAISADVSPSVRCSNL